MQMYEKFLRFKLVPWILRAIGKKRLLIELVSPFITVPESPRPQLFWCRIFHHFRLFSCLHIHCVYLVAIGCIGETDSKSVRIFWLGLHHLRISAMTTQAFRR